MSAATDQIINISKVTHYSPFRYPGGKTWLVPHALRWLSRKGIKPKELIEPFAGGAIVGLSVLFSGLCEKLILVEMDENVGSVWSTILNGGGGRLAERICSFNISIESVQEVLSKPAKSKYARAFATIVKNRVHRGGILAPGASFMKNGENGKGLASRWYPETLKQRILRIVSVKDRIQFIQGDAFEILLKKRRNPNAVFFIDPPYTVAGRRLYAHSEIDHVQLFRVAASLHGDFLMTYDNTEEIRHLAKTFGFDTEEIAMKNTHHAVKSELLIGRNLDWVRCSQEDLFSF